GLRNPSPDGFPSACGTGLRRSAPRRTGSRCLSLYARNSVSRDTPALRRISPPPARPRCKPQAIFSGRRGKGPAGPANTASRPSRSARDRTRLLRRNVLPSMEAIASIRMLPCWIPQMDSSSTPFESPPAPARDPYRCASLLPQRSAAASPEEPTAGVSSAAAPPSWEGSRSHKRPFLGHLHRMQFAPAPACYMPPADTKSPPLRGLPARPCATPLRYGKGRTFPLPHKRQCIRDNRAWRDARFACPPWVSPKGLDRLARHVGHPNGLIRYDRIAPP